MRRRALGHASANSPIVENGDGFTFAREQVSRRQSCNASTDDAHVCMSIYGQRRELWHFSSRYPDRSGLPRIIIHGESFLLLCNSSDKRTTLIDIEPASVVLIHRPAVVTEY